MTQTAPVLTWLLRSQKSALKELSGATARAAARAAPPFGESELGRQDLLQSRMPTIEKLREYGPMLNSEESALDRRDCAPGRGRLASWAGPLATAIFENWMLVILLLAYILAAAVLARVFGFEEQVALYTTTWLVIGVGLWISIIAVALTRACWLERPAHPIRFIWRRLAHWQVASRLAVAVPPMFVFPLFFGSFTSVKSAIGTINPYALDPLLVELDMRLHGVQPWELLRWLHDVPFATRVIDVAYGLWLPIMYLVLALVVIWVEQPALRRQYLVAFTLSWCVLGSAAAIALSSVGPCYFGAFYWDLSNPFAEQSAALRALDREFPIWALRTQDYLLRAYEGAAPGLAHGISAAPSLHVAIATLQAIVGWKISRPAGVAATGYLVLIMTGSVHLGWHYAVDGYLALLAVPLLWKLSGWMVQPTGVRPGRLSREL